jgi:Cytochrome P450
MIAVDERGVPVLREVSQLPYLNAVIRDTLRLYALLPTSEPRSSPWTPYLTDITFLQAQLLVCHHTVSIMTQQPAPIP